MSEDLYRIYSELNDIKLHVSLPTARELAAIHAMSALLSSGGTSFYNIPQNAVEMADLLMAELAKPIKNDEPK